MKKKKLAYNLILVAAATLVCLLVLEFFFAALKIDSNVNMVYIDQGIRDIEKIKGFQNTTKTIKTNEFECTIKNNAQGFNDEDHSIKADNKTFRILGVGDSFTYGYGADYEDTYLRVLEKNLNKSYNIEIIKRGFPRYYPAQELKVIEEEGLKYSPNLIILLTLPNDVVDTCLGEQKKIESPIIRWLLENSYLSRFVYAKKYSLNEKIKCSGDSKSMAESQLKIYEDLKRIKEIAFLHNASFIIITIPQIDGKTEYNNQIEEFGKKEGIPVLNLGQGFSNMRNKIYWPIDGHLNPLGYSVLAEETEEFITETKVIPPEYQK